MIISEELLQLVGRQEKAIAKNKVAMAKILQPLAKMPKTVMNDLTKSMNLDEKLAVAQCRKAILENKRAIAEFLQPIMKILSKIINQPTISTEVISVEELEQFLSELEIKE
ncbi:MAG: hypothetical protein LBF34_04270 [Puniceicoccales bacterium]|jgi:anion-transporting  ArsA/GET3 family ATPase|nr:hypothetical protein [Puniceicoccales bacterium]